MPFLTRLGRFTQHPATNFCIALLLFGAGLMEAWESWAHNEGTSVAAHHGVVVYGLFGMMKALPSLLEGLEKVAPDG